MKSTITKSFRERFEKLPAHVQKLAQVAYRHFQENPSHPGLQFKCIDKKKHLYSARVGDHYRVLGYLDGETIRWFWIGSHEDYNHLVQLHSR